MPKYNVYGRVVGTKFLGTYEAATKAEAEEMAVNENGHVSVCHQCSSEIEEAEIDETTSELADD